jgi:hypothetical protein
MFLRLLPLPVLGAGPVALLTVLLEVQEQEGSQLEEEEALVTMMA